MPRTRWRHWHRWLSLLFGLQLFIWSLSGAYMVLMDLDFIHGDHLINAPKTAASAVNIEALSAVTARYPESHQVTAQQQFIDGRWQPVVQVDNQASFLVFADTMQRVTLSEKDIAGIAQQQFAGENRIQTITLLTEDAPSEIPPSILPIWQVEFDQLSRPTLYLDPETGNVITKRHNYWRLFDFAWMLHIMDYENRVDITNTWIQAFIVGNILLLITGIAMVIFTIVSPHRSRRVDA